MIRRVLIANRGEIACRVMRTCRALAIETVAVYSEADADLPHVRLADQAVCVGPAPARESYLDIERILAAARATGADAIHPGYGFLSENAAFAEACEAAGLVFIGPTGHAIRVMGDKAAARQLMAESGVPVLPGFDREGASDDELRAAAEDVGFPLLIKAVAGGGGKGMRIVEKAAAFDEALAAARREARAAFNDDRVLLERYLARARHVEVQVFADTLGNTVHLFERDCSVQRRHQKIIEEAPAPGVSDALRAALGAAAVKAAEAINYRGAGTVEFLLAEDQQFYFMEMNTRLQVEHPVTELITGEDLVAWQLTVAQGQPLPKRQEQLQLNGHAMEIRFYAEDPDNQFLPSSGLLSHVRWPQRPGVRVDTGFEAGNRVSDFYDPMLAKVIAVGADRNQARLQLAQALRETEVAGIQHNLGFLARVLEHPAFAAGELSTRFLDDHAITTGLDPAQHHLRLLAAACHALATPSGSADPWARLQGWRPQGHRQNLVVLVDQEQEYSVRLRQDDNGLALSVDGGDWLLARADTDRGAFQLGDQSGQFSAARDGEQLYLFDQGFVLRWLVNPVRTGEQGQAGRGFAAPMNGTLVANHVAPGSHVKAGDAVVTMEAMKMEHTLRAPTDGQVLELPFSAGDAVSEGALLATFVADGE